jgi:hypothetical protein
MTLVGTEAAPSLELSPGKYAVHEDSRDFAVDVTNIRNDSAVVTRHGAPTIVHCIRYGRPLFRQRAGRVGAAITSSQVMASKSAVTRE